MLDFTTDVERSADSAMDDSWIAELTRDEHEKLIVALDYQSDDEALDLVNDLGDTVVYYKVGLELLFGGGLDLAKRLRDMGKTVFLDMKLHDIPNTVEKSVRNISKMGFNYLTVHGVDIRTLDAAVTGRGESDLNLLAVTVLTSAGDAELKQWGTDLTTHELGLRRARMAFDAGFTGVIASGHEAMSIRNQTSNEFLIKVPGIRLPSDDAGDQSRVMTPAVAIEQSADYLVVGRPITQAPSRRRAAMKFLQAIVSARTET
ncbi:MAG: orotidine-5'-phosphate decarboxylase [Pseudomonadota bacterium]